MIINPDLKTVELTDVIAFDTEFNNLDTKRAFVIAFSITNANNTTYVFERLHYSLSDLEAFFQTISTINTVICHNAKADTAVVYSNFNVLLRNTFCTMLAAQVIDNGYKDTKRMVGGILTDRPFSLVGCLQRYCRIHLMDNIEKKKMQNSFINHVLTERLTEAQLRYAGEDTSYLIALYNEQQRYINERELQRVIRLENTLVPVLVKLEFNGCLIDTERHKANIVNWEKQRKELINKLDNIIVDLSKTYPKIYGGKFTNKRNYEKVVQLDIYGLPSDPIENENLHNINYSSSKQLTDLCERLEIPIPQDKEGKDSFSEDSVNDYLTNYPDTILKDFFKILIEFKEYDKLLSTYGQKFLNVLDSENRLRTSYTQCFTATGRLSSTEVVKKLLGTNLANIPKRSDIRNVFIPDEGYSFVDCDMTGQEVVLAASYSREPVLIDALKSGFDHHSFLATKSYSILFDRPVEVKNEKTNITVDKYTYTLKELRDDHKSVLFAKFYGGGANRIKDIFAKYLARHVEPEHRFDICKEISTVINNSLPVLIKFLKGQVNFAKQHGYNIANKLGRRRYYDDPEKYYGEIMNFPIQSSGADAIKIALINTDKWFEKKAKELNILEHELGWIVLTVYDQNLCALNDKYIELAPELQRIMAESLTYFLDGMEGSSDLQIKKQWSK
jgi:DNA polymerase I-like protein with 3'-5' exonuclease and polymerase domains